VSHSAAGAADPSPGTRTAVFFTEVAWSTF
jgi:hypothetical protein